MTQQDSILFHMRHFGCITPLEALRDYGCLRLAARIYDLRKKHRITETDVTENGKRYAMYRLEGE